ncbi:MAG: hypothetical protein JWQ71_2734 [Pedosphaera sp.]|nr:hypothetical protein [Pedosphaera sp.]
MAAQVPDSWQQLFLGSNPSTPGTAIPVRIIHRRGEPFLILPADSHLALSGLSLYPAQTSAARLAKLLLSLTLKLKLLTPGEIISLPIDQGSPFVTFLAQTAGTGSLLRFALLAGNPHAPGRRFVLLLFNGNNEPAAVVKAGLGESATGLIKQEISFLSSVPHDTYGVPRLGAVFQSERHHAFALDFLTGHSPQPDDLTGLESLLARWIDSTRQVRISELPAWHRLAATATSSNLIDNQLQNALCCPVIYHGDLAPWNIKVANGLWQVLDWERGELAGIPGWDWFHYIIQSAVLIQREPVNALAARVENLLTSGNFQRYAAKAQIVGIERQLLLAYLNYSIQVLKQTEGLSRIQSLLAHLAQKWRAKI